MQPINPTSISSRNTEVNTMSFIASVRNVSLHFGQSLLPDINKDAFKVNFNPVQFALSSVQLLTGGQGIFSTAVKLYGAASALGFITGVNSEKATKTESKTAKSPIPIKNCEELFEIGAGTATPNDGRYILVNDINCENKHTIITPEFKGNLEGGNYKISKLKEPIFEKITGGSVKDLQIVDSTIKGHSALANVILNSNITDISFHKIKLNPEYLGGLLTKSLQGSSSCLNIWVSNSSIAEWGAVPAGSVSSVPDTLGSTGGIIGEMIDQSRLENARLINSSITTTGNVHTGGAVGWVNHQAKLISIFVDSTIVDSKGHHKTLGGVVGLLEGAAHFIDALDTQVTSFGKSCRAGGLIGKTSSTSQTSRSNTVRVSTISYELKHSYAGILIGQNDGSLNSLSSVNSTSKNGEGEKNLLIATNTNPKSTHDVTKRTDCRATSFAASPYEEDCSVRPEEEIPELDVSPFAAGVFLSGMLTGAVTLAASTSIAYLTYKYVTSEEQPNSMKERANLLFKPVITEFSSIPSCQKPTYAVTARNKQEIEIEVENETSVA